MTANVNIETASAKGVLKVPNAALRFRPTAANGTRKAAAPQTTPPPPPDGGAPGGEGTSKKSSEVTGKVQAFQPSVWILEATKGAQGTLKRVPVTVGLTDGTWTEVSGDLSEGEAVVTGALGNGTKGSSGNLPRRVF
jgi:HlyD family secretion protein